MHSKMNQALTQSPLYFDPDNKDVNFPELMPIFHNRFLSFPPGSQFDRFPEIEGRMPGEVYPDRPSGFEIPEDSVVRITCYAPGAKSVAAVEKEWETPFPLRELGQGYWGGELSEIRTGFHYQEYYADGNRILNPLMPIGYSGFEPVNYYEVPEPGNDFFYLKDIPHGTIHMERYFSDASGEERICYVYTPPSYRKNRAQRYPVLYLLHGWGESETAWIWQGRVNYIADNLFWEQSSDGVVIVMNNGYTVDPCGMQQDVQACFSGMLIQDCIPFIERKYRTVSNKQGRAVAGDAMMYHSLPVYEEHFGKIEMMNAQGDDAQAWDIKRKRLRELLEALCR